MQISSIPSTFAATGLTGGSGLAGASAGSAAGAAADSVLDPAAALKRLFHMSPADLMRQKVLKALGLTEADYQKMSAQQRAQVDAEVANRLKQDMEKNALKGTGAYVDIKA